MPSPSGVTNKRRITPSAELSAPWSSRHVLTPFQLRDLSIDIFKGEVRDLLYDIFPKTNNVTEARFRCHLIFQVDELPKGPWPLTVGGVPITILEKNTRGRFVLFHNGFLGNLSLVICKHYNMDNLCDNSLRSLSAYIYELFKDNMPNIRIIEVIFTSAHTVEIVIGDHVQIGRARRILPGKIAGWPVAYVRDHKIQRPRWADRPARSPAQPQPESGIVDTTAYDVLRPGVMISSEKLADNGQPAVLSTTSGILVKDRLGVSFMTAASHSIGESKAIWQSNRPDKIIGRASTEIPYTDVSLIRLTPDVRFHNENFDSVGTPSFSRLVTSEDNLGWTNCHLNSSFTGNMESTIVAKSVRIEESEGEDQPRYVAYNWAYTGQVEDNEEKMHYPDGTSGSAVWNDDGIVLGFHHYYIADGPYAGFSCSVSASELAKDGYSLVK